MKEITTAGKKIAERRKLKGYSQESLANESGISLRTIQRIERNQVKPQPFTLKKIADVLDLDVEGRVAREWRKVKVPGHAEEVLDAVKAL